MGREKDELVPDFIRTADSVAITEDTGRLLALSDGVFAFAMTLLVINLSIPSAVALNSPPYAGLPTGVAISRFLGSETSLFISYVVAFLVIAVWWTLHRRIFRHIRGVDAILNWTNIAFLMFIAVTPFVTGLNGLYGSTGVTVALYSAVQCAAGMTMGLIALHVSGKPELAHPTADRLSLERTAQTSFLIAGIFSVAASIAQYNPTYAGYAFYTIIIVTWHSGGLTHRERPVRPRRTPAPATASSPGSL
ncbi:MAG TPA: TMEM175 family protein [Thermoplasmata archaeon]|nr:TMEM175 family protein [Thermoplasmata archaeon]